MRIVQSFQILVLTFLVTVFSLTAHATVLTFTFSADRITDGSTSTSAGSLADTAKGFMTIDGTLTYDTATTSSTPGTYATGLLTFDQFTSFPPSFASTTIKNDAIGIGDQFQTRNSIVDFSSSNTQVDFRLEDDSAAVFSSLDLPTSLLLAVFQDDAGDLSYVNFRDINTGGIVQFGITSLSQVPLPAAAWFFFTAMVGLFGAKKLRAA